MAATKTELQEWIEGLPDAALVAIDNGGLTLVAYAPDAPLYVRQTIDDNAVEGGYWFEIGGVNIEDEEL